jgi:hypothetical protein
LEGGSLALSGNYSVGLFSDGSISQTGLVPDNAESVQFETSANITGLALNVILGGDNLGFSALSQGTGYTVYGINIPAAMDGQMETLTFRTEGATPGILLDNIEFSPMSVPEPSACALLGLGAILLALRPLRKISLTRRG